MSGRQLQENPLLMRGTQESGRGGVGGGWRQRPGAPGAVEVSGRPGGGRPHRVMPRVTDLSELLFVSSSPALRCSVSDLSDR